MFHNKKKNLNKKIIYAVVLQFEFPINEKINKSGENVQ